MKNKLCDKFIQVGKLRHSLTDCYDLTDFLRLDVMEYCLSSHAGWNKRTAVVVARVQRTGLYTHFSVLLVWYPGIMMSL